MKEISRFQELSGANLEHLTLVSDTVNTLRMWKEGYAVDWMSLTAVELGKRIKNGDVKVEDAVRACLSKIEKLDIEYNCFISVDIERALLKAAEIQKKIDDGVLTGPLAGVPIAIKDNICVKGMGTTCGSKILSNFVPTYNATVVEKLEAAGAIIIGKTNMDEFAMGNTNETSFYGPVKNPVDNSRVAGGSSGGSAAAVALNEISFALGSDTGGSIRQPASYCGVVGIKPTYGRVSRYGLVAYGSSLDQIGPIAKDVTDCANILDIICGHDEKDSTSYNESETGKNVTSYNEFEASKNTTSYSELETGKNTTSYNESETSKNTTSYNESTSHFTDALVDDVKGMKIGIPSDYFTDGLDVEVKESILKAAEVYRQKGAIVEEFNLGMVDYAVPAYYIIACAEASSNLERFDGVKYGYRTAEFTDLHNMYKKTRSEGFGTEVKRRIMLGAFVLSSGYYDEYYVKALKTKALIKKAFDEAFAKYDVILAPVAPTVAPKLGEMVAKEKPGKLDVDPIKSYLSDVYTVSANLAGIPAISVPCGTDSKKMPLGMQLMGRAYDEKTIIRAAYAFECS